MPNRIDKYNLKFRILKKERLTYFNYVNYFMHFKRCVRAVLDFMYNIDLFRGLCVNQ